VKNKGERCMRMKERGEEFGEQGQQRRKRRNLPPPFPEPVFIFLLLIHLMPVYSRVFH